MRLTQIEQILEIEKCTSISQAARNLFISQPALSTALNELESEIGMQIFSRTKKGVSPTKDGAVILEVMKNIMQEINYIETYSHQLDSLTGSVSFMLGASYEFLYCELIQRFKEYFPKADLRFMTTFEENIQDKIAKDLIDFAIMPAHLTTKQGETFYANTVEEITHDKSVAIQPLNVCHSYALLNRQHPLCQANRTPTIMLSQLLSDQLVLGRQHNDGDYACFLKYCTVKKCPIINIERSTIYELLDHNYAIFLDATPLSLQQYQQYYPQYQVFSVVNDIPGLPDSFLEWSTFFMYKKNTSRKLQQFYARQVLELLQQYQLLRDC